MTAEKETWQSMQTLTKLVSCEDAACRLKSVCESGKKVVFTNGCFDILHAGHVRYLTAARSKGDVLVVGLNSDFSVKHIKDAGRPFISQAQRAEVLSGLTCVDLIVLFDEPDPLNLIRALKPDILVKGDDWAEADIIGANEVRANGGQVVRIPVVPGISTTTIIEKILRTYR